jgi:chlorite dismutase
MWFWLISKIANVSIGIFICISAKRLRYIDVFRLDHFDRVFRRNNEAVRQDRERSAFIGTAFINRTYKARTLYKRRIGWEDIQTMIQILRDFLDTIKSIAKEFNRTTDITRWVLVWAAVSFFYRCI